MELGRVTGQVVATIKQDGLHGLKLLLVVPLDPATGEDAAGVLPYVAVDLAGAGQNEVVVVARGSGARVSPSADKIPTDAAVVAIVDSVIVDGKQTFDKSG